MKMFKIVSGAAAIASLTLASVFATALTDDRGTPERDGSTISLTQGSNIVYQGSIVAQDGNGIAVAASDTAGYNVIGVSVARSDNRGADYDSAKTIDIRRGVFRFENGGSFTNGDIGDFAYVLDDQTVFSASQATNDIIAGIIIDVDDLGVWVDTLSAGGQGASSLASLLVSGASTLSGTVAAGGKLTVATNVVAGGAVTSATLRVTGASVLSGAVTFGSTVASTTFTLGTNAGVWRVDLINGTNKLVYVNGAVTNVIDQDIAQ